MLTDKDILKITKANIEAGKEIFLKGISCHEESVENGKALSIDEIRENLKIAKELGCNFVRLAHYPHSRETARLADELGMMLWEEIPVYWAIDFGNPETFADAQNQMTELILRDWRRASVIIWRRVPISARICDGSGRTQRIWINRCRFA